MTTIENKKPSLLCAIPCRDSLRPYAFSAITAAMMRAEKFLATHVGSTGFGFQVLPGVQAAEARTELWKKAVEVDADWILWFDDDIVPPLDIFEKLWRATPMGDIVTAFYWRKGPPFLSVIGRFTTNGVGAIETSWIDPWDMKLPYEEVSVCGFGCVLTKRKVLDHISLEHNGLPFLTKPGNTEDVYFCNAARRYGYKVIAVQEAACLHVGDHTYGPADRQGWLKEQRETRAVEAGAPMPTQQ